MNQTKQVVSPALQKLWNNDHMQRASVTTICETPRQQACKWSAAPSPNHHLVSSNRDEPDRCLLPPDWPSSPRFPWWQEYPRAIALHVLDYHLSMFLRAIQAPTANTQPASTSIARVSISIFPDDL